MQLVFATHNENKFKEVKLLIPKHIELLSLKDIGCFEEIPETAQTIAENAILKAEYVYRKYKVACFADDTGLEVDALNGAPGVYSARYAGPQKSAADNINKLLLELKDKSNRGAQFKTVIALKTKQEELLFQGIVRGSITTLPIGSGGFGYDPVFIPEGYSKTFAELPITTKNEISHRAKALQHLLDYLKK